MNDWVLLRRAVIIQYAMERKCMQELSHLKAAYNKKTKGDQGSILKVCAAATYDLPVGLTS